MADGSPDEKVTTEEIVDVRPEDLADGNGWAAASANGAGVRPGAGSRPGSGTGSGSGEREVEIIVGEVEELDVGYDFEASGGESEPVAGENDDGAPDREKRPDRDDGGGEGEGGSGDGVVAVNAEDRIVEALPQLARLAAEAATRSAAWGFAVGLRTSARLVRATVDPLTAAEVVQDIGTNVRGYARDVLGISDLEERLQALTPPGGRFAGGGSGTLSRARSDRPAPSPEEALREQGMELLRQSADVSVDDEVHPAFARILGELAPDEGRVLRLLSHEGPQPVVDVRAANLIGVGSQLVSANLNMVDRQAGLRHQERVAAYLGNLSRLGLICFSDKPLEDAIAYQVLEAQPHVLETLKDTSRAKSVQRSLRLTDFGTQFCDACFPPDTAVRELTTGES